MARLVFYWDDRGRMADHTFRNRAHDGCRAIEPCRTSFCTKRPCGFCEGGGRVSGFALGKTQSISAINRSFELHNTNGD